MALASAPPPQKKTNDDLACENVIERPKVIYNAKTGKFAMWLHQDSPDYQAAHSGVVISDTHIGRSTEAPAVFQPDGKYYLIGSSCTGWKPNAI